MGNFDDIWDKYLFQNNKVVKNYKIWKINCEKKGR